MEKGYPSDLKDINGKTIVLGDKIRFLRCPVRKDMSGIWEGTVVFGDGVFTIDCYKNIKQIENPIDWEYKHNYIDTRGWCISVGYGEYGTWNVHRKPLTDIQTGFGWTTEQYHEYYRPLCEKYGWGSRYINVEIVND